MQGRCAMLDQFLYVCVCVHWFLKNNDKSSLSVPAGGHSAVVSTSTPRSLWSPTGHVSSPSLSPPLSSPVLLTSPHTPHFLLYWQGNSHHPSGLIYPLLFHWSCPSSKTVWLSNHSQFILLFLSLWSKDSLTRWWVIYHCIMGLELFWVNTDLIRSAIPSCLPDELWESAFSVRTKARLGKAIFSLGRCHSGSPCCHLVVLWVINAYLCFV